VGKKAKEDFFATAVLPVKKHIHYPKERRGRRNLIFSG